MEPPPGDQVARREQGEDPRKAGPNRGLTPPAEPHHDLGRPEEEHEGPDEAELGPKEDLPRDPGRPCGPCDQKPEEWKRDSVGEEIPAEGGVSLSRVEPEGGVDGRLDPHDEKTDTHPGEQPMDAGPEEGNDAVRQSPLPLPFHRRAAEPDLPATRSQSIPGNKLIIGPRQAKGKNRIPAIQYLRVRVER